ncbi:arsenosugar biosynthesis radical SAM (seleno)protein ArsS [Methylomonas fluvii]|uniref:Arsenosugar biosynthesis radical SAM protein ArsS n=1 Tax=Methylomonas fluvii TaxID=1854564 RepID=A0ABR9DE88_9GAMM|nr:arsenosugar biosynthesis radical SAM (seleno)protein ArsS [Methylomonas fluvii]MBD9361397.1 arsenosugar biosynthesis radical SAM protein ArsS [Methylomonas fluvii]CAD6874342.1 Radical SAM domain-containing protein [Methylomonas fluvii]
MHDTKPLLANSDFPAIFRKPLEILQINLGYRCNLSCVHCHVNAGPKRTEMMSRETIDDILALADAANIHTLDLTGGAPEMHADFRYLVRAARDRGIEVIDRCNLTILEEPEYADLAAFLAAQQVNIVASLPCYLEENVDKQRGKGVFKDSLAALQHLNRLGYGQQDSGLELNLVFNPQEAVLPPDQHNLERAYKQHLQQHYGIVFNRLFAIANMPIQRFGSTLVSHGCFEAYLTLLKDSFRADNLENLMCLNTLSIDWQGYVYDCDFNQMLDLPLGAAAKPKTHISELRLDQLQGAPITTAAHCYGCTAGQGSSCGGALG